MTLDQIITSLAIFLGGGAVVKLAELWLSRGDKRRLWSRESRTEERRNTADLLANDERFVELVVKNITKQRDDAFKQVDELKTEIEALKLEMQGLRIAQSRDPFPRWIVNSDGKYLYVNRLFEEMFLRPKDLTARDIIGKYHEDFWPKEFARKLHALDEEAKRRHDGKAKMHTTVHNVELTIYKLPVRDEYSGVVIGYDGIVTDVASEPEPFRPATPVPRS